LYSCVGSFDEQKLKQGRGVYIWMNEANEDGERTELARYEGNYVDGKKHGVGKFVFPSGDVYEGEFVNNKMHGMGTYTYKKTQDIYSGEWSDDKKHGQGRYEFAADKSMLVGVWVNGHMVSGDWELKDSAVYSGTFRYGVPVGPGKFRFKSGLELPGVFEEQKTGSEEPVEMDSAADEETSADNVVEAVINTDPPMVTWRGEHIISF
jgi:hypothetical protein